jgi:lauroyl/myristoyl acyltransferase
VGRLVHKKSKQMLPSVIRKTLRADALTRRLQSGIAEGARLLAMVLVLRPAADYLPSRWARALARRLSFLAAITVMDNGVPAVTAMKRAFGLSHERAVQAAREWLATQFCDFVVMRRIARGREDPTRWKIVQRNENDVCELRDSGAPFIIAFGQFSREACAAAFSLAIAPFPFLVCIQPKPPRSLDVHMMRIRTQVGQIIAGWQNTRPADFSWYVIGQGRVDRLVKHLQRPQSILYVTADAYWFMDDAYLRPFGGHRSYRFTTRVAGLARSLQCPIIPCIPSKNGEGSVILEWGPVIAPPSINDVDADTRTTDKLINHFERAIGLRPSQYANAIGADRRWNPATEAWEDYDNPFAGIQTANGILSR